MAADTLAIAVLLFAALASLVATGAVRRVLARKQVLDHPNARSSHDLPTPRGGGLAVVGVLLACWIVIGTLIDVEIWFWPPIVGALSLAAVSFLDDLRGLGALTRLGAQGIAVTGVWMLSGMPGTIFGGAFPNWLEAIVCCVAWVWFVNLFNFMDGIDGITGSQTIAMGLGLALLIVLGTTDAVFLPLSAALIGVSLGFLRWNWHRARIFLGDVGSVPLGFILGWSLLWMAASGHWASALILPLYYLADATITLLRRALRGEKVWQAHNQHFYQRALRGGHGHDAIVLRISAANACLVILACIALWYPIASLVLAGLVVSALLWRLAGLAGTAP